LTVSSQLEQVTMDVAAAKSPRRRVARLVTGRLLRWFGLAVLAMLAVAVLYPFFFTINTALKSNAEYTTRAFGMVHHPTLTNVSFLWQRADLLSGLRNSLVIAAGAIVVLWIAGAMAGFAVAKLRFRVRLVFFVLVLSSGLIPFQTIVSSLFIELQQLGLLDQYVGIILVYAALGMPLTVFLFAAYFKGIPDAIIEAARLDGASTSAILVRVILPMARPALAITGMVNFVVIFNDLLTPLVLLQSPGKQPFVVDIARAMGQYVSPTQQAAGVALGLLPLLVTFLFAQRFLVRGVVSGAVR
jgi:ABC-type glycerol-3-phosphate transport system permease component